MNKNITFILIAIVCCLVSVFFPFCVRQPPVNPWQYQAKLSGENEIPPVNSLASGVCNLRINADTTALEFELSLSDGFHLLGLAGAHLHFGDSASIGAPIVFLAGPVAGGFNGEVLIKASLTSNNIINVVGGRTIKEIVNNVDHGMIYVNVHSSAYQAGEIRGQVENVE